MVQAMNGDRPTDLPFRSCSTLGVGMDMVNGQNTNVDPNALDEKIRAPSLHQTLYMSNLCVLTCSLLIQVCPLHFNHHAFPSNSGCHRGVAETSAGDGPACWGGQS